MAHKNLLFLIFFSIFYTKIEVRALESENIIGGIMAKQGNFSYHVYVMHQRLGCGGCIIGSALVVTAAHCVTDRIGYFVDGPIKVIAGATSLHSYSPTRIQVFVDKVYLPIEFQQEPLSGDIAILRLQKKLKLGIDNNLSMLELPPNIPKYRHLTGRTAYVTGSGVDLVQPTPYRDNKGIPIFKDYYSFNLKYAAATVLSDKLCKRITSISFNENDNICARTHQTSSIPEIMPNGVCRGDSGGPLVLQGKYLIGILSTGPHDCNEVHNAAIYTSAIKFSKFFNRAYADDCDKKVIRCAKY